MKNNNNKKMTFIMKKVYWACKHICMLNWFDSFWLTSSTHSWINLSCFLILGIQHSSSDKSLQRFQEAHFRYSRKKGCGFFGKIQIRISESKIGFCIVGGKSKNGSWIHKIHTLEGFFGSNPNQEVWDSQSGRFFSNKNGTQQLSSIYIRILFLNPFSATFFACM